MNSMLPRYGFNLEHDRFDTQVMAAFQKSKMARHTRDALIAQIHDGRWDHLLPNRLNGLGGMSAQACAKAAVNVVDYYFEPLVLKSMRAEQLHEYFCGFAKTLRVDSVRGVTSGAPVWVETVHHVCIFSILYDLILHLARHHGYRRAVLLHQGQRPEPRLAMVANLLQSMHRIQPNFIQLNGNWFAQLSKLVTPDMIVLYLSDVPAAGGRPQPNKQRDRSRLRLTVSKGCAASVDTTAGGSLLARRLKAQHVVLEYPGFDGIRLRPFDPDDPSACVPLQDWVFWPLLKVV